MFNLKVSNGYVVISIKIATILPFLQKNFIIFLKNKIVDYIKFLLFVFIYLN